MTIVFSGSPVANVQLSDSFNTWRLTTNKILSDAASLTANNTFAGTGSFSSTLSTTGAASFSNTVSVTGALTASRTLSVTNNITAAGNISANSYVTTGNVTANNVTATNNISAALVTATNFNSTSDNRLKENIETLNNPNDVISQLRGVSFNWKNNGAPSYGVIAQELQQIVPNLVHENQSGDLTVQYMGLIAFLIESNKQLLDRVVDLESKLS